MLHIGLVVASLVGSGSATVVALTGTADVVEAGATRSLSRYAHVSQGSTVVTHKGGNVSLRLASGTVVRLGEGTQVALSWIEDGRPAAQRKESLKLAVGRLWARVSSLFGSDSRFEVEAPNAVAGVRGTSFFVVTDGATAQFTLEEGVLGVRAGESETRLSERGASVAASQQGLGQPSILDGAALAALHDEVGGIGELIESALDSEREAGGGRRAGTREDLVGPEALGDDPLSGPGFGTLGGGAAELRVRLRLAE